MTNKMKLSTVVCLCCVIFSSLYFIESFSYSYKNSQYAPGAGFLPRWVGGLLLVLSIIAFVQSFKQDGIKLNEVLPKGKGTVNIIVSWVAMLFFTYFAEILGVIIAGSVMLVALFTRGMKWQKSLIVSVIVSICCYLIFKVVLQVPVPSGIFGF